MTQTPLNRAVAQAAGETVQTIHDMGFQPVPEESEPFEEDDECLWLDCFVCGRPVRLENLGTEHLPDLAECLSCDNLFDYKSADIYVSDPLEIADHLVDETAQRARAERMAAA